MIKLSEIKNKTKRLDLEFQGEGFWVEYKPNAFTLSSKTGNLIEQTILYISDWDVIDDKGRHVEFTEKALQNIPVKFLSFVMQSVADDIRPDKDEKKS